VDEACRVPRRPDCGQPGEAPDVAFLHMPRSTHPRVTRISKNLHFVSQGVLRGFCNEGGFLMRLDVKYQDQRPRLRTTGGVGYRNDLRPGNPDAFERTWQPMESSFPESMDAVLNGTVLDDERLLDVLRDCLAVHFARSNTIERFAWSAREPLLADAVATARDHPLLASPEGLVPVGSEARAAMAQRTIERIKQTTFRHEAIAPERMIAIYQQVRARSAGNGVEILVANEGEFIIGDTPAHTFHPDRGIDVAWDEAMTVFMPIGRHHAIALGPVGTFSDVDPATMDMINRVQVATAEGMVAWHPEANMEDYVKQVLSELRSS
jgi:hypothetical protein